MILVDIPPQKKTGLEEEETVAKALAVFSAFMIPE